MNLPFSLKGLGADGRLRKQEKDAAVGLLLRDFRKPFRSSQTAYCYTCGLLNAERGMTVPRNIFTCADYPNPAVIADLHSQTVCATLLCRACLDEITCVAVMYLTLRTGCERHGRKILCRSPISQRSHVGNLRQTLQGKGVIYKRVETVGVYPLVPPPGRRTPR